MFSLISLAKACLEEHLLSIIYYLLSRKSIGPFWSGCGAKGIQYKLTSEAALLEETCKAPCVCVLCGSHMWVQNKQVPDFACH